jgi:hypothetical protein
MTSAQPIIPAVTLMRALFSVPADRASKPFVLLNIFSAVKLRLLFWLHRNNNLMIFTLH